MHLSVILVLLIVRVLAEGLCSAGDQALVITEKLECAQVGCDPCHVSAWLGRGCVDGRQMVTFL